MNIERKEIWKEDTRKSVEMYNSWFLNYAPKVYSKVRSENQKNIREEFEILGYFKKILPEHLKLQPRMITTLRMCTAPPLARDRLIGFADVSSSFISNMEQNKLPRNIDVVKTDIYILIPFVIC